MESLPHIHYQELRTPTLHLPPSFSRRWILDPHTTYNKHTPKIHGKHTPQPFSCNPLTLTSAIPKVTTQISLLSFACIIPPKQCTGSKTRLPPSRLRYSLRFNSSPSRAPANATCVQRIGDEVSEREMMGSLVVGKEKGLRIVWGVCMETWKVSAELGILGVRTL